MRVFVTEKREAIDQIASVYARALRAAPDVQGATEHFTVSCMPDVLPDGARVAATLLKRCEADYQTLSGWFGLKPPHFSVILAGLSKSRDGTGGAFHASCSATDLYCDVELNPQVDARITCALAVAEEVEVFSAIQNRGWDCGASNGEGLSRVLAAAVYPAVIDAYATAPIWLDSARPDWVGATNMTDTDPVSNGCSVLFLNWLHGRLGFGWDRVCGAGAPTLAETYKNLTGKADAWKAFSATVNQMFPPGKPSGLTNDDPF